MCRGEFLSLFKASDLTLTDCRPLPLPCGNVCKQPQLTLIFRCRRRKIYLIERLLAAFSMSSATALGCET